ncbi:hypothetical protein [Nocardia farcinica]|uniref:hypothetical protein n=1 Tax=Nocardia farcinica TaxID=37329 RepID=UPI0024585CDE|nr:hypothetical protein [Nocardia farcinica]
MTDTAFPEDARILYEVARLTEFGACDSIWWRHNENNPDRIDTYIRCSDVFYWGTSDLELVTLDALPALRQAIDDVEAISGNRYRNLDDALLLFVARVRRKRPQGAYYPYLTVHITEPGPPNEYGNPTQVENKDRSAEATAALHALFNAAGPERAIDLFNPKEQNGVYRYKREESA